MNPCSCIDGMDPGDPLDVIAFTDPMDLCTCIDCVDPLDPYNRIDCVDLMDPCNHIDCVDPVDLYDRIVCMEPLNRPFYKIKTGLFAARTDFWRPLLHHTNDIATPGTMIVLPPLPPRLRSRLRSATTSSPPH